MCAAGLITTQPRVLMINHVITFTPGNGDSVRPGYHTSRALASLTVQFIAKRVPIRFEAAIGTRSAF